MGQKFYVDKSTKFVHENGAVAYGPGGSFDCLGRYAKIVHCPIEGEGIPNGIRLTCYATGYADTFFSVPACTRYKGKHIGGFFTMRDGNPVFRVYSRFADKLKTLQKQGA
jgi:hypothetical protein